MTGAGHPFKGVGVALLTFFGEDGGMDVDVTSSHAIRLVERGVAAVVVAGTTGEAAALERDERVRLLEAVKSRVSVPVIAGTGAPSARQAVTLTEDAFAAGADAVLVLSPRGSADPLPYYEAVRSVAREGIVLAYHFPQTSPPGIPLDYLRSLPVDGLKDSSGDPDRLLAELTGWDKPVYTGSSALLTMGGALGCEGAILSLANLEPERCVQAFAGDTASQLQIADAHLAASARFPAALKELVSAKYGTPRYVRT